MERLIVTPELTVRVDPPTSAGRHVRFVATLESTGDFVVLSDQPLVDGARELLARGYDPAEMLTMRHEGKAYDSFQPAPIGQWAGWTYTEGETSPLRKARWMPRPGVGEGQKSGAEHMAATHLPAGGEIASTM